MALPIGLLFGFLGIFGMFVMVGFQYSVLDFVVAAAVDLTIIVCDIFGIFYCFSFFLLNFGPGSFEILVLALY